MVHLGILIGSNDIILGCVLNSNGLLGHTNMFKRNTYGWYLYLKNNGSFGHTNRFKR